MRGMKHILVTSVVVLVVLAITYRVAPLRNIVIGQ